MDTSLGTWMPARRKAPSTPGALRSLPAVAAVGRWPPAQWDTAIPYWRALGAFARQENVQLALEMHANQLVYNAPTVLRLREAAGPVFGANLDPRPLMWMGADPVQSARALEGAIYHVHAKDTRLES